MVNLIVVALGVWRISSLLVNEDGPAYIFGKLRTRVGIRFNHYSQPYAENDLAELFLCVWCLSVWVGLVMAILWIISPTLTLYLSLPFAFSTVAIIVEKIVYYKE
jgi:hypothetical protein